MTGMRGVVFDLDGVVVETEHLWEQAWSAACARRGKEWRAENTARAQGMSRPEWAAYVAEVAGEPERADAIGEECVGHLLQAIASGEAELLDGARSMVVDVAARVPVALASSAARPVIDAVLAQHGLTDAFSATVSSEEVPRGKPNPDVYLAASDRIGLDPIAGGAVEDSTNGLRAAHAAGFTVVALPNATYPPKAEATALAAYVASDHDDALGFLLQRIDAGGTLP